MCDLREWAQMAAALGSVLAAIAAWRSACQSRKALWGQMVNNIMEVYSSPDMLDGIHRLQLFRGEHTGDYPGDFAKIRKQEPHGQQLDKDRRRLAHWFHRIRMLVESGVLNECFVKKVVSSDQVSLLLVLDEPLEKAINPNYDKTTFDLFRRLYPEATKR